MLTSLLNVIFGYSNYKVLKSSLFTFSFSVKASIEAFFSFVFSSLLISLYKRISLYK